MSLYKYVVPERLDILRNLRIRFTQPTAQNDPFEFRPLVSGFRPPELAAKDLADEWDRQLPQEIGGYQGILTATDKQLLPLIEELKPAMVARALEIVDKLFPTLKESLFQKLSSTLGILSLSETPSNDVLWAYYASNHSGFVLELDEKHAWFSGKGSDTDEFRHLRKVTYIDQSRSTYLTDLHGQDVFYSKLKKWSHEEEWRIIRPLTEGADVLDGEIYLFDVPADCIIGVIRGVKTAAAACADLDCVLRTNPRLSHIRLLQAAISTRTNTIEIHPAA